MNTNTAANADGQPSGRSAPDLMFSQDPTQVLPPVPPAPPEAPAAPAAQSPRVATLEAEVAGMRIKPPSTGRDTTLMWLGVALLVAGVATSLGAYLMSHSTTNVLEQRDAMVASVCGIPLSIAGLALFLRYSLSGFLRFWIARLIALQSTAPTQGLSAGKRAE